MEQTRYLIIGSARSGTTALHLAVLGHPNAAGLVDELRLTPLLSKGRDVFTKGNDPEHDRAWMLPAVYDALTTLNADENTTAHGAKVVCNSPSAASAMVSVLQQQLPNIKIILVRRKDLVAQFGSGIIGRRTGVMHAWNPGATERAVNKITISRWQFTAFAAARLRTYDVLSSLAHSHEVLNVDYESLLDDAEGVYRSLYRFLGLPEVRATWVAAKKLLPPPDQYILNYASMQSRLHMIEQSRVGRAEMLMARAVAKIGRRPRRNRSN
jgi:hypothetical protein